MEILKIRIILDKILKSACDFRMIAYKYKKVKNKAEHWVCALCWLTLSVILYSQFNQANRLLLIEKQTKNRQTKSPNQNLKREKKIIENRCAVYYSSCRYKYRKFMKHIENWLAFKILSWIHIVRFMVKEPRLSFNKQKHANKRCAQIHTGTHRHAYTNRRSHLFLCTPHKQHLWFNVNYVYNWLNRYTSRQSAFHLYFYTNNEKET